MKKTRTRFPSGLLIFLFLMCCAGFATAETTTFYHHDVLGTTLAQSDESGNVVWWANYYPYGSKNQGNSSDTKPQRYTGKEFDDETGLYYFGARYYNPKLARFVSIDPASGVSDNPQTWNRYSYALNNPYKFFDPDGREVKVAGPPEFVKKTDQNLKILQSKPDGKQLYDNLNKSKKVHTIVPSTDGKNSTIPDNLYAPGNAAGSTIKFNPDRTSGGVDSTGSTTRPAFVGLGHEMGHSEAIDQGTQTFDRGSGKKGTTPPREINSIKRENQIRSEHGQNPRPSYY